MMQVNATCIVSGNYAQVGARCGHAWGIAGCEGPSQAAAAGMLCTPVGKVGGVPLSRGQPDPRSVHSVLR